MAVSTSQRQARVAHRPVAGSVNRYQGYEINKAAVRGIEYGVRYPEYYPDRIPAAWPRPTAVPKKQEVQQPALPVGSTVKKKQLLRGFCRIGGVFLMCMLMLYRYAVILESNDRIAQLNQTYAALEADNQAIQTKLEKGLELGALEEYATGQLGMIRPDSSQVFYVDVKMENTTQGAEENNENRVLQGTPGALVHAIQVLK